MLRQHQGHCLNQYLQAFFRHKPADVEHNVLGGRRVSGAEGRQVLGVTARELPGCDPVGDHIDLVGWCGEKVHHLAGHVPAAVDDPPRLIGEVPLGVVNRPLHLRAEWAPGPATLRGVYGS